MMKCINKSDNLFLKQSQKDTWNYYCNAINKNGVSNWNWIILTASNEEQAKAYREEIDYRLKRKLLPRETQYAVIPDQKGKRVGSGGATLNALKYIYENLKEGESFDNQKILIIHSGGDSKRVPQYSISGKLFSPVQRKLPDGRASTLFDEFIITFSVMPDKMDAGMLILSGDVLLCFNPLEVNLTNCESAGISIKVPAEIGVQHGVFVENEKGNVKKFLHKQPIDVLKDNGAIEKNYVNIDTGAIYFNKTIVNELFSLISTNLKIDLTKFSKFVNPKVRISFYSEFVYPLAIDFDLEEYKIAIPEGELCNELLECREIIWRKLQKYKMKIIKCSPAEFIHFGTTMELQEFMTTKLKKYRYLGWQRKVLCNLNNNQEYSVNNAYISANSVIEKDAYIENSYIGDNCRIGSNTIISNAKLENIDIPENICLQTLILKNRKYVTRIYSITDNPKILKTNNTPFLNTMLEKCLQKYKIEEQSIWDDEEKSIWKANLYCVLNTSQESIQSAMQLYNIINCKATQGEAYEYFLKKRISLCTSFNECDVTQMKEQQRDIYIKVRTEQIINLIQNGENAKIVVKEIKKTPNIEKQIESILERIKIVSIETRYRTYRILSLLLKKTKIEKYSSENFEEFCYKEIKNMIIVKGNTLKAKKVGESVDIQLPVRTNFGGGWSDTPPYCNENGGSVLNVALKLNGNYPIKVHLEKTTSNSIVLESKDLNMKKEFTNVKELKHCTDVEDVFSLHKASLIITGILQPEDKCIEDIITRIGSGIYFSTQVNDVPKGSGLGTSSILSVACIKALCQFMNIQISDEILCYKALEQEQLMSTGGRLARFYRRHNTRNKIHYNISTVIFKNLI